MKKSVGASTFKKIDGYKFANLLVDALKQMLPKNCWPKNATNKDGVQIIIEHPPVAEKLMNQTIKALNELGYDTYDIAEFDDEGYELAAVKGEAFAKLVFDIGDYFNNGMLGYIDIKTDNGNVIFEDWWDYYNKEKEEVEGVKKVIRASAEAKARKLKRIKASKYYEGADTYVVKIWHEVDDMRGGLPSAAEEIFTIVANSPSQAIEIAKDRWTGPIDRIEIVDINPDDDVESLPFDDEIESCGTVSASSTTDTVLDWYSDPSDYPNLDPDRFAYIAEIEWDINPEDVECILADDLDLSEIAKVSYLGGNDYDEAMDMGFEGGYEIVFKDGSVRRFGWRPYPENLDSIVEF